MMFNPSVYSEMNPSNFKSPNGHFIVGTAETVLATAWISYIDPMTQEPEYEGGTKVYWNSQETLTRNGHILFVCTQGDEWTFDQLVSVDPKEIYDNPVDRDTDSSRDDLSD